MQLIALDLFCGAGGASKGLLDAGFEKITGVDNKMQPSYSFCKAWFWLNDIFNIQHDWFEKFDFIWASPPCQCYSFACAHIRKKGKQYPDLISKTRKLLLKTSKPFVIENVVGSPLRKDLLLCGGMFGLRTIRHRIFEIHGFECNQLEHPKHKRPTLVKGKKNKKSWYQTVSGHGGNSNSFTLKAWQKAMGIDWINNKHTLAQCVPPAYAKYIGKEFLKRGIK